MDYLTYLSSSPRYIQWYPSEKYPRKRFVQGVWSFPCSAASNAIHPQLIQPTHCISTPIFLQKIHPWWSVVGSFKSNIEATYSIRYQLRLRASRSLIWSNETPSWSSSPSVTPYVSDRWSSEYVKFTDPCHTSNLFFTQFLCCTSSALVALKVLIRQNPYHNRLWQDYIEALRKFKRNMFTFVFYNNLPPLSATIISKRLQKVDHVIIRGLQYFLPRIQGFTNVREMPPRRKITLAVCETRTMRRCWNTSGTVFTTSGFTAEKQS